MKFTINIEETINQVFVLDNPSFTAKQMAVVSPESESTVRFEF